MTIEFEDIITLEDEKEYVVASKINYTGHCYIYIIDINDHSNIKFAEVETADSQIYVSEITSNERELLDKIMPLFLKNIYTDSENIEGKNGI